MPRVSRSAGILSRANELKELTARREALTEKLDAALREADEAKRDLNAAQYELDVAREQQRGAEDAVRELREGTLVFHAGRLAGSWPRIVA